jgi:hypothetical protein
MRALLLLLVCAAAGYGLFVVLGEDGQSVDEVSPEAAGEGIPDIPRPEPEGLRGASDGLLETAPGIASVGVAGVDEEPRALLDWGAWREYRLPPREERRTLTGEDFLEASKGRVPIRFASAQLLEDFRKLAYREGQRIGTHEEVPLGELYTLIAAGRMHFEEREAYLFIGLPPDEE